MAADQPNGARQLCDCSLRMYDMESIVLLHGQELSNSAVAHKLHFLKGGIAAWLHEAGDCLLVCSLHFL